MNSVQLIGRTTKEIDLRKTNSGKAVANVTLAVNNPFDKDNADFINVILWGKQAELAGKYVSKGNQIGVTGRMQTRSYENKDGLTVYVTEVVASTLDFLTPKPKSETEENDNKGDDLPF